MVVSTCFVVTFLYYYDLGLKQSSTTAMCRVPEIILLLYHYCINVINVTFVTSETYLACITRVSFS